MSMINDALKRASQSDRNRPRPPGSPPGMEPVSEYRGRTISLALILCILLALILAAMFFWEWYAASSRVLVPVTDASSTISMPAAPVPLDTETAKHESRPAPITPAPSLHVVVPTPAPAPSITAAPVPAPAPAPAPPPKPANEPWPAEIKISGIFFSKTSPRALINGKSVGENDFVDGIRIVKIEKEKVTVEWKGHTKEVEL